MCATKLALENFDEFMGQSTSFGLSARSNLAQKRILRHLHRPKLRIVTQYAKFLRQDIRKVSYETVLLRSDGLMGGSTAVLTGSSG